MVTKKASALFSGQELDTVRQALREAESKTSGELVAAVATVSGRYDRAEDIVGLLVGLGALTAVWLCGQGVVAQTGDWAYGHSLALGLLPLLLVVAVGFAAGSALATYFPVLRLPFIAEQEKKEEVERRAAECFYRFGIGRTAGATGILIYVSLYERMVVVKGDQAIAARIEDRGWQDVCKTIIDGFKLGQPCFGLCSGIAKCGEHLAHYFPKQADDVNELEDVVYLID
jgi:putative membrane protein